MDEDVLSQLQPYLYSKSQLWLQRQEPRFQTPAEARPSQAFIRSLYTSLDVQHIYHVITSYDTLEIDQHKAIRIVRAERKPPRLIWIPKGRIADPLRVRREERFHLKKGME